MVTDFFDNFNIDPDTVLVGGAPGVDDNQKQIVYNLLSQNGVPVTDWHQTGAVISSHGGPGAIGLAGIEKSTE